MNENIIYRFTVLTCYFELQRHYFVSLAPDLSLIRVVNLETRTPSFIPRPSPSSRWTSKTSSRPFKSFAPTVEELHLVFCVSIASAASTEPTGNCVVAAKLAVADELLRLLLGKAVAADGAESPSFGLVFNNVVVAFSADGDGATKVDIEDPKLGRLDIDIDRLDKLASSSSSSNIWPAFL